METILRRTKAKAQMTQKNEMFQGKKYEDGQLQGEKENGKKKGVEKEKR